MVVVVESALVVFEYIAVAVFEYIAQAEPVSAHTVSVAVEVEYTAPAVVGYIAVVELMAVAARMSLVVSLFVFQITDALY
mmetsp:Transcript_19466/g.24043  ORF Transcript_19466/g.24043 Transcript_19466/m.24043 type:complete len:80 (+) Transcript_19466:1444-1683(+)|eukprot:CAMPEP_0114661790 /NCGR_PEP_ID=MMETSP0191-20121206/23326_1 /TAXON_ID=126664 /ORGANISM="Sorites sp." /LENGTH=79 /DNA_ID=CAMNT_0001895617 /DNA_START=813 /DNA_END=1049 /DNA_ORIENTATION=-